MTQNYNCRHCKNNKGGKCVKHTTIYQIDRVKGEKIFRKGNSGKWHLIAYCNNYNPTLFWRIIEKMKGEMK